MKTASNRILDTKHYPFAGESPAVVTKLRSVAQTFSQLQEDRHFADYNLTADLDPVEALRQVKSAQRILTLGQRFAASRSHKHIWSLSW